MSRFAFAGHAGKMMGQFVQAPGCREFGYDWRYSSPEYKRVSKRALSRFRRNDGKLWTLEGLRQATELEAVQQADLEARLADEFADYYEEDDEERDEYYYDQHEDYDYWANYHDSLRGCCEYHDNDDYENYDYERGFEDGYQAGLRAALQANQWSAPIRCAS